MERTFLNKYFIKHIFKYKTFLHLVNFGGVYMAEHCSFSFDQETGVLQLAMSQFELEKTVQNQGSIAESVFKLQGPTIELHLMYPLSPQSDLVFEDVEEIQQMPGLKKEEYVLTSENVIYH